MLIPTFYFENRCTTDGCAQKGITYLSTAPLENHVFICAECGQQDHDIEQVDTPDGYPEPEPLEVPDPPNTAAKESAVKKLLALGLTEDEALAIIGIN